MKIYVVPPYYDWEYDKLTDYKYCITFEDDYDLEIISKLIKEGDIIRIIHYNSPRIVVQNVNFIEQYSFTYCINLVCFEFPEKVISIEDHIFFIVRVYLK